MYRIQGSDQKEYGPIPAETIRQWITERRLNRDTLAALEGEGVWKPLGQFPEFAALLAPAASPDPVAAPGGPTGYSAGIGTREQALARVKGPAIAILILSILGVISTIGYGVMGIMGIDVGQMIVKSFNIPMPQPPPEQVQFQKTINTAQGFAMIVIGPVWNIIAALGAIRMQQLRSRGLAMTSAILTVAPCCSFCCLATIPIGIWALVVLGKPEVKSHFT